MLKYQYIAAPLLGYLICGLIKFIINSVKDKKLSFTSVGLGGMPSTHTTIVSSSIFLIGLNNGFDSALFGLGLTFIIIIMLDAVDLRRKIGVHAKIIKDTVTTHKLTQSIRSRIGHKPIEVIVGVFLGAFIALLVYISR